MQAAERIFDGAFDDIVDGEADDVQMADASGKGRSAGRLAVSARARTRLLTPNSHNAVILNRRHLKRMKRGRKRQVTAMRRLTTVRALALFVLGLPISPLDEFIDYDSDYEIKQDNAQPQTNSDPYAGPNSQKYACDPALTRSRYIFFQGETRGSNRGGRGAGNRLLAQSR